MYVVRSLESKRGQQYVVKLLMFIWLSKGWFAIQLKHRQRQRHELATIDTTRRLEPKCGSQLFLGSLLRTRLSAIGHFSLSQKSLRRLTRPSFLFSTVANTLPLLSVRSICFTPTVNVSHDGDPKHSLRASFPTQVFLTKPS